MKAAGLGPEVVVAVAEFLCKLKDGKGEGSLSANWNSGGLRFGGKCRDVPYNVLSFQKGLRPCANPNYNQATSSCQAICWVCMLQLQ